MWCVVSIDDLDEARELLQISLNHSNIEHHLESSGLGGLALTRDLKPDLVILDLMLPGMDGKEVYEAIRADDGLAAIPILIVSVLLPGARRFPDNKQDDMLYYLSKPFNVQDLRNQIKFILNEDTLWA